MGIFPLNMDECCKFFLRAFGKVEGEEFYGQRETRQTENSDCR